MIFQKKKNDWLDRSLKKVKRWDLLFTWKKKKTKSACL